MHLHGTGPQRQRPLCAARSRLIPNHVARSEHSALRQVHGAVRFTDTAGAAQLTGPTLLISKLYSESPLFASVQYSRST
jgi:hypothetical protein